MLRKVLAGLAMFISITLTPAFSQRILIDIGADPSKGGIITTSPSINGYTWNNMTNALPGVRVSNAFTTSNQSTTIGLEVINRLDGTYSPGQPGIGNGNNAVVIGDYPGSATTDHALVHSSAVNGRWRIFGLDTSKTYTIKFWGARTNTTASRHIEIKRSDNNTWLTYNATGNTNYNHAIVFSISGKTEMGFDIRTKAGSEFSCINVLDISFGNSGPVVPPTTNNPPVANAGNDIVLNLPADSTILNGCGSYDPENAALTYQWTKVAGPQGSILSSQQCSTKVNNLIAGIYIFELAVKDTGNIVIKDSVKVTVNNIIPTPWPALVTPSCPQPYKVVVVGSSSAYGTGATPLDSSWVSKFRMYVQQQNAQIIVINIATPGLTSYQVLHTSFVPPPNRPFPDPARNITKALSLNPHAIIINLPSNDIAMGYSLQECYDNFNMLAAAAEAQNVPVWVTTTQPRDRLSPNEKMMQMTLRDWIIQRFGSKSVDFWSTIGNADGSMNPVYSTGDSVHQNNYGHHILFTRMVGEHIWDTICNRMNPPQPVNQPPVAMAGADQIIRLPLNKVFLDGRNSSDPDGNITAWQWLVLNGPSGSNLQSASMDTTTVSFTTAGTYTVRLMVTDNTGATSQDDVIINVQPQDVPPPGGTGKVMRVNIYGGINPYANSAWNNWNSVATVSSSNFFYEDGSVSSINAVFNSQAGIADNGSGFGASATVCPGQVLRYNSFNTSVRTLILKGLDPAKSYYMEFYGARVNLGNKTVVNIGTVSDTIDTDHNISDYAKFVNVVPQSNGHLVVNLSRIGTYNYMAGFTIKEQSTAGKGVSVQTSGFISAAKASVTEQPVVYPNPFSDKINIQLGNNQEGPYQIRVTSINGVTMLTNTNAGLRGIPFSMDASKLNSGIYFLTIQSKITISTVRIIKP